MAGATGLWKDRTNWRVISPHIGRGELGYFPKLWVDTCQFPWRFRVASDENALS